MMRLGKFFWGAFSVTIIISKYLMKKNLSLYTENKKNKSNKGKKNVKESISIGLNMSLLVKSEKGNNFKRKKSIFKVQIYQSNKF